MVASSPISPKSPLNPPVTPKSDSTPPASTKTTQPKATSTTDEFKSAKPQTANAQPKFGGTKAALAGGALSFGGSALVCWPLAIGAFLLGLIVHPLLPVSAALGLAPFAIGALGGWLGSRV